MVTLTVTATVTDAGGHTATATTTATIAGTELERRNALGAYGTYRPAPADVGLLPDVARSTVSSLATVAGGLYENKVIAGRWSTASNSGQTNAPITFRNVDFTGATAAPAADDGCVAAWGANHIPIVIEDSRITPAVLHYFRNAISGHHVTLRRCEIARGVDGMKVFNTNDPTGPTGVAVYGSWFHDSAWFDQNPAGDAGSATHNDTGLQILGGSGTTFVGNVVDGYLANGALNTHGTNHSNSCLMIKPDVGNISDVLIDRNWLDGGAVQINLAQDGTGRVLGTNIVISNNVFGHGARLGPDYSILMPSTATGVVTTGNVHTTGEPANVRRNG
jgi:hypothetical protein